MAVDAAGLLDRVRATVSEANTALATKILALATGYVTKYQLDQSPDPDNLVEIPAPQLDEATLACAEDIWVRTKAQNGIVLTTYQPGDDGSGVTVRIGRDPLVPVRPLLRPWLPGVFAL